MNKRRTMIYINFNPQNHEFIYTGIEFYEFVKYLQTPIKNILLIKANYMGNNFANNFELVEGLNEVEALAKEDVHGYGDFCFLDYAQVGEVDQLTDNQIAEILYMAHMYKPLKNPFFEILSNRFTYLAHDDGWFGKLYCRESNDFLDVLNGKIVDLTKGMTKIDVNALDINLIKNLLKFSENGMLIDFEELKVDDGEVSIKVYTIGKHNDMDRILNDCQKLKENSLNQKHMKYKADKWHLVKDK